VGKMYQVQQADHLQQAVSSSNVSLATATWFGNHVDKKSSEMHYYESTTDVSANL
jgi:hypothetical protein